MRNRIYAYAKKYNGDYYKIRNALQQDEAYEKMDFDENFITIYDEAYPACFLQLKYPPFILFYEGDVSLLKDPLIAIVGGRLYVKEGKEMTILLTKELSKRYTVVSGMAKGIDAIAHMNAKRTIGVLGHGLDIVYPKENEQLYAYMKQFQLLITEYPKGVRPQKFYFPFRNRLIAALGSKIVVPSCQEKGGTMVTVNEGLRLNKEIYTVPYSWHVTYAQGCNHLIEQGANMILSKEDIEDI